MTYRISTDIGGTFTDVAVVDGTGETNIFKSPTTPKKLVSGVIEGLKLAAEYYGEPLHEFMGKCEFFGHGSTVSTNALIEGKTAKVGLLCTQGHRDVLLFREGGKENPFEWYLDYPEPYVPRYLTLPVTERMSAEGEIITPLNEDEVRKAVRQFKEYGVEVIAVSLLWSFVNPAHELRVKEIIEEEWPELESCTLSHVVNPRIREYRRTVSTVIDASLKPLNTRYVGMFQESLGEIGYKKEPYLFTTSGGLILPEDMVEQPIYSIDSGPALAPISGKFYAMQELGKDNVITCDMGGTSFDIGRITDGEIIVTNNAKIGHEKLSIPKVDVKTIGAGGGSITWVDGGGLIRIGPEGAGSEPGPACYMRGGERATVTDAALVLGYLDENYFLGGRMKLNRELAEKAIKNDIADPLGVGVMEAAHTVWNTATAKMAEAIRDVTVWEGIDPKEYVFVAGGGAVGIHILPIVSQLGAREIIIPKTAATLSAFGGAVADVVREFQRSYLTATNDFDYDGVNAVLAELKKEADEFLDKVGIPEEQREFEYLAEARYPFQEQELSFSLQSSSFDNRDSVNALVEDFHEMHDQVLGSKEPGQYVECVVWKLRVKGVTSSISLKAQELAGPEPAAGSLKGTRQAYFKEQGGLVETKVYDGERLKAGNKVDGPAIIEEPTTNLVVFPGEAAMVSKYGNYIVDLRQAEDAIDVKEEEFISN
ncbi:hydantoinase/oxoprolinase family protein [Siminovitchia sediminis]|uniref:Hydantoinase/oxoprolinase family protein n=1 Tax=Siminovitchia sediminis TaxID=1274353 RepID=A0ABW4KIT1_9BACI